MAPIKFEDNIREKLQERELQPSKEAWDKLSKVLDQQMPQRKNTTFFWMAVAASLVGIIIVTTFFLRSEMPVTPLVQEESTEILPEMDPLTPPVKVVKETQNRELLDSSMPLVTESATNRSISETETKLAVTVKNSKAKTSIDGEHNIPEKEAVVVTPTLEVLPFEGAREPQVDSFVNKKIEEVVAEVHTLQELNNEVTAEEIDALLAKAQRDISNQRLLQNSTKKIDASALLMDVELELEQSFREKVFQMLGEGFHKIRTAVSERNN
jgi:hypothetical protein